MKTKAGNEMALSGGRLVAGAVLPEQTEKSFQQAVLDYARLMGWRCYFTFNSRHSPAGYPDLCMVRRGRMVVAELKSERGRLTRAQEDWLRDLAEVPSVETAVWRPADWSTIEDVLR